MNKLMLTAALALALGAGAASAATLGASAGYAPRQQFAQLSPAQVYHLRTTAPEYRNMGPSSSAADRVSPYGNANSGMPSLPGAPTAGPVNGGN